MKHAAGCTAAALATLPVLAALAVPARAGDLSLTDDIDAEYKLTVNYSASMRVKDPDNALVNGPINATSKLPSTINFDDGDRNFKAGSLVNNRISGLAELLVRGPHYGLALSGDGFYDQVYHHPNDNDSPGTVNKSEPPPSRFTDGARYYDGQRVRLLDAYLYGNMRLGPHQDIDLRVGRQVAAWGEALFFSGIATAQAPADASKAFIPGIETKDILLPSNQVSLRMGLTDSLTLLGYYKLEFKPTELSPVGDFFSTTDVVGPGSEFIYLTPNPVYGLTLLPAPLNIPLGQLIPGTPKTWIATRGPDLKPSDYGQYGAGLNYQLTAQTTVGAYYLRYDDTAPMTRLNEGYQVLLAPLSALPPALQGALQAVEGLLSGGNAPPTNLPLTSQAIGVKVPVSYNVAYQDGIHMGAVSFSTQAFGVSFAGEASYRDGIDLLVNPATPSPTRGKTTQADFSALEVLGPGWFWDDLNLIGEVGYIHINAATPVGGVSQLSNGSGPASKNAWAYSTLASFDWKNVFPGWDITVPLTFQAIAKGSPPPGTFGALWGEGDQRATGGVDFSYLQRLTIGLSYSAFLGRPDLAQHPYADRDFAGFNVKYQF